MWYEDKAKDELDYSKPIIATNDKYTYLLLPVYVADSFRLNGFDWFDIRSGKINSCVSWKTPQEAVEAYRNTHEITNAKLTVTPIA